MNKIKTIYQEVCHWREAIWLPVGNWICSLSIHRIGHTPNLFNHFIIWNIYHLSHLMNTSSNVLPFHRITIALATLQIFAITLSKSFSSLVIARLPVLQHPFLFSFSFNYLVQLAYLQNYITNQPSLQFQNSNEFVVGLGDELNAELKATVQIFGDRCW